jgi:hypothetical protein
MLARVLGHLRAQWAGVLALFLVLTGGVAYAANTVFSTDIVDNQVRSVDVRDDTLAGGGLAAADLRAGSVGTDEIANGAVRSPDVRNEALTGADVDESSLGQVPSARLGGIGRSVEANDCDPESGLFVACAFTQLDVPPPGARALVLGDVSARTDAGEDFGIGDCQIHVDRLGGPLPGTRRTFKINDADDPDVGALVGVTSSLSPGLTAFGVTCQDASGISGGIRYLDIGVSVVLISDN